MRCLFERHEQARRWFDKHTSGLICGLVDESALGDVLIYAEHKVAGPVPVQIRAESAAGPAAPGEAEAVSIGIDSRDDSLTLDETPVYVDFPRP
jgi:hypothetical protein